MRGHHALIDLRLRGSAPQFCSVTLLNRRPVYRRDWEDPEYAMLSGFHPEIDISPDENVNALDLRCLRGMTVNMNSFCDAPRTLAALHRIVQFEPQRAATLVRYPTHDSLFFYEKGRPLKESIMERMPDA